MNEQMMQEVLARIDALAAKFGIAAEYLWDVFMRQQVVVNGWMQFGVGVVFAVLFVCSIIATSRGVFGEWDDDHVTVEGIFTIIGYATIFPALILLNDGVCHLLNPAYYAFKAIIGG